MDSTDQQELKVSQCLSVLFKDFIKNASSVKQNFSINKRNKTPKIQNSFDHKDQEHRPYRGEILLLQCTDTIHDPLMVSQSKHRDKI